MRMSCRLFASFFAGAALSAWSANLTWDANTGTTGAQDGSGAWTITTANWWDGALNVLWSNATPDYAVFGAGGVGGVVTASVPVTVAGITFTSVNTTNYYTLSGSTITLGGPTLLVNTNATINNALAGSVGLTKTGSATLTLGAVSTYSGGTRIHAGVVQANASGALGTDTIAISNQGVRLSVGNNVTLTNAIVIGPNAGVANNGLIMVSAGTGTVSGPITINNGATAGGIFAAAANSRLRVNGTITSSVPVVSRVGNVVFSGGGSYNTFTLGADTVGIGANNGIATNSTMTVAASAAGIFDLSGFNQMLAGITNVNASARITSTGATVPSVLTLNTPAGVGYGFGGTMDGSIALVKTGEGTQTFSSAGSAYTGDVTVAAGALRITAASSTTNTALGSRRGARTVTIQTNATLRFDVNNVFGGSGLTAAGVPKLVANTGTIFSTRYNTLGNVVLNGGLLTQTSSDGGNYQGFQLLGTVTVGGSSPSTIDTGNAKANHLNTGAGTTFDVADVTGSPAADLIVNAPLTNSSGDYAGVGHLTKTGAGTLLLAASNMFSGTMTISGGRVALGPTGSVAFVTNVVLSGGSFDVSATPAPYMLPASQAIRGSGTITGDVSVEAASMLIGGGMGTPGTIAVQGNLTLQAGSTNYFDLTNSLTAGGGINDLIDVSGILTANGQTLVINPFVPLVSGNYRLFNYGANTNDLSFGPLLGNTTRDIWSIDTNTAGQVNLQVTANAAHILQWTGGTGSDWDNGATNWFSFSSAQPERFYDVDQVLFDDSGATVNVVTVSGIVKPASVLVSASSNYTLTGIGSLANGFGIQPVLTKDGAGTLTISLTNSFSGGVIVSAGRVLAAADAALGTGTVQLNGGTLGAAGNRTLANAILLGATAGLDDQGNNLRLNGVVNGTSTLVKTGSGSVTLTAANTYTGTTVVSVGTVQVLNNAGLGGSAVVLGDASTGTNAVSLLIGNQRTLARPILVSAQAGGPVTIGHDQGPGTGAVATVFSGPITLERDVTLDSGNQTDRLSFDGVISGTGNVSVVGTKRITLGGTNNFVGNVSIAGSNTILQTFAVAGSLPDTASVAVDTDAIFQINQSDAIDALTGSGFVQPVAANPTLTIGSAGGSGTFSGIVRNNGANFLNVTKVGAGTETFAGAHTATGATLSVNAGALVVGAGGSVTSYSVVTVASGAVFDVTAAGPHTLLAGRTLRGGGTVSGSVVATASGRLVPGTGGAGGTIEQLTITGDVALNATSTNYFNLTGVTNTGVPYNDLVVIGGNLEPSGSVIRIDQAVPLTSGRYVLMTYAPGAKTTTFNTNVDGNASRRLMAVDEATPGEIALVVSGSYGNLRWVPLVSSNWNFADSNWVDDVALTTNAFLQWDNVLFDDSGAYSNGLVNLAVTATASRVIVNASSNYTISGVGRISGPAGIVKDGSGTLTISTANDFTGDVEVSNGTFKAGSTTALGSTAGVTRVVNAGTLDVNGLNLGQEVIQISGAGAGGIGAIVNSGAAQINALQYVRLLGDAAVGGTNRFDIRSGVAAYLDQAGFTLTKVGPSSFHLVAANATNGGDMVVNGGMLSLETTSVIREPGTIYINPGATLQFYLGTTNITKPVVASNATILCASASTVASPFQIEGVSTFNTSGGALGITNVISGGGMLVKTNANTLNLTGENTYTGGTLVVGGELQVGNNSASGSIVGTITNNAAVYFYRTNAVTLTSPIYGTGSVYLRTREGMTIDGNSPIQIGGNFNVGQNFPARLILTNGASVLATNTINIALAGSAYVEVHSNATLTTRSELLVGNNANNILYYGDISQYGGEVNVLGTGTGEYGMRLGHYPGEVSFYRMFGGTLNVTNAANGTSALYLGIDGVGILDVQGGVINAKQLIVDGRGGTVAVNGTNEQLIVTGGRINLGSGGLATAGGGEVYLGGGTLGALTNWSSGTSTGLLTQLTGTNGNTVVDPGSFTITLAMPIAGTGGIVKVGSGQLTFSGAGSFLGGVLVSNGTVAVAGAGTLANNAANFVTVRSGARFTLNKVNAIANGHGVPCLTPVMLDGGTLELLGDSENRLGTILMNAGTILLNGGDTSVGDWGALYLPDPIVVTGSVPSVITNTTAPFSTFRLGSNTVFDVADVTGSAAVDLQCYAPLLNQAGTLGLGGFTKIGAGTMASYGANVVHGPAYVSNGVFLLNGAGTGTGDLFVAVGATLGGSGAMNGALFNAGTVAPGASTGTLTVANYVQGTGAVLAIEIGGVNPGVDHDQLSVTGTATLDGALNVSLTGGFVPTTNDQFLVFSATSLTGGFATTNLPALSGGDGWKVDYLGGLILLSVTNGAVAPPTGYDLAATVITNGLTGYQDDADGDGYANLLEYVTGGSLTNGDTLAAMNGIRTNGLLALRFNRNTNATDTTIVVEGSDSAVNGAIWLGVATNIGGSWGAATNIVSAGTNSPLNETVFDTAEGTNRFLRLRVTRP